MNDGMAIYVKSKEDIKWYKTYEEIRIDFGRIS